MDSRFTRPRSPAKRLVRLVCLLAALAIRALPAAAADTAPDFEDFDHAMFTARQGAPGGVNALAQDTDGFLWLGTSQGLYRFDGVRFVRWRAASGLALPDTDILALHVRRDGVIWVGTRFGHIYAIRANEHTGYGEGQGVPAHPVFSLVEDGAGQMWAGTSAGVFTLRDGHWQEVRTRDGAALHVMGYAGMATDRDGRLWVIGTDSGVFCLQPGAHAFEKRRAASALGGGLTKDISGAVWIADDAGFTAADEPVRGIPRSALARLVSDRDARPMLRFLDAEGVLWGHSNGRLLRLPCAICDAGPGALQRWPRDRELSGDEFLSWIEDREGNIWTGTNGGLDRFHRNKFERAVASGATLADVALAARPDGLVVGTHASGLYRRDTTGAFVREPFGRPDDNFITSLYVARDGTLWVGGDGELHRSGPHGYEAVPFLGTDANYEVQAMAEDEVGGLWLSAALNGLYRFKDGRWTRNGGLANLPSGPPLALRSADGLGLWIGYPNSVVAVVRGGQVRTLGPASGLTVGNILSFWPDGARMWVAGAAGVALVDGARVLPFAASTADAFTGVSGLLRTPDGDLWLNGAEGVSRVPAAEIAAFVANPDHRVAAETFGVQSGIEGTPENLRPVPSAAVTPDGRLWFATTSGLFSIDPRNIRRNAIPPRVHLLAVHAGGREYAAVTRMKLAAGTRSLQIDFTTTCFSAPELVRFRYRLDGVDAAWQDSQGRRQADYTNLPPGQYHFRVTAANEDGVWSPAEETMTLVVPAAFWQTGWFKGACVAIALALAAAAYRLRTRALARSVRLRLEERLDERERIARELHDTLLQGTQGLVLGFQVAAAKLPGSDPRRAEMESLLDRADEVVAEARDRLHMLRSPDEVGVDLPTALTAVAGDLAAGTSTRLDVRMDPALPPVRENVRCELFFIGREALINAFRHARSRTVSLELFRDPRGLRLAVRDDGEGIAPATLAKGHGGHFGLQGMRERAKNIGATLQVRSEAGRGTEIDLLLPAERAFTSPSGEWPSRKAR